MRTTDHEAVAEHKLQVTRVAVAVSLGLSVALLALAQLLFTVMRPSLVRPLVYFVSSAAVLLFFSGLILEHVSRYVRLTAVLALAVESVHLLLALLGLYRGLGPALGSTADANWLLGRALLVLVLVSIRVCDERTNAAPFRIATSAAIVIACFAVFSTPVLFHARAVALIIFYSAMLLPLKDSAISLAHSELSRFLAILTAAFTLATGAASAWMCVAAYRQPSERVWTTLPRVAISAMRSDDVRLVDVVAGVEYWNVQLRRVGSGFRLGPVSLTDRLTEIDRKALTTEDAGPETRKHVADIGSSIVVVLQDEPAISFVHDRRLGGSVVVVITAASGLPARPNVLRNIVAHELGHAIGLQHNDAPESLMCGAPAPCSVNRFESTRAHHFPLTLHDDNALVRWYPQTWKAR